MNLEEIYRKYKECSGVNTDTRKILKDNIFFALKGPNFNANRFALQALESGARYAVVDEPEFAIDERFILVEDGLKCLQQLATYHRRQLGIPVLGITGSNGKTTTKELVNAVLSQKYKTYATVGNFNNHIGVPLTILAWDESIELAIVEMGANKLGDIRELCEIAEPNFGLITNIGRAHIGEFGGFENILRAKSELYQFLLANDGKAFINSNNPLFENMARRFAEPIMYPNKGDSVQVDFIEANPFVEYRSENGEEVMTHLIGDYNFENIAAALAVGKWFNVLPAQANEGIRNYIPENNRSQIIQKGDLTIILDAYNANPSSMEVALKNLSQMSGEPKYVILGDMYELGEEKDQAHGEVGQQCEDYGFESFFVGEFMTAAKREFPGGHHFFKKSDLVHYLEAHPITEGLLLIKASRSMGLESLLEQFH
ncbi:UDP-N-acetylmuramoyl-tripeptide--D-alanyl-D-alanine ligase [Persicobacter sp. CCB-QB2]|uniref:UDP-N-acetylmuramoyl-tripeptide--D-alanyl-D- alanine ligase n=1 Tax=Persicobacter sp. CCB-QB2 TaxID=1561025 RepID=UPI0006A9B081|nr:UDP-N-acetylmuramoyl-tripeptide--D-alanyl-D-alanine ligase [Persicobacter sp. CCB-QB2]